MIALLGMLLAQLAGQPGQIQTPNAGRWTSQQGTFLQSGTGATLRTLEAELRDKVKCAQFSGADIGAQITAAIAALPATGGLIDCRMITGTQILAASLTLNKANTVILLGNVNIVLGTTNQVIVPVGTHMVAVKGTAPWGSPSSGVQSGTQISYTGTGVAFKVGDGTANTDNFLLEDVGIDISQGAVNGAIGLQLNRAKQYDLIRPRFNGQPGVGNTQKDLDLEGLGDYTGGNVVNPRFDNGNTAVYLGADAKANFFFGGNYAGPATATSIGFDFAGASGHLVDGNTVYGGDVENWGASFHYDYASDNQLFGIRTEVATNLAVATANSYRNMGWTNGVTLPIIDAGAYNAFATTLSPIISQTKIQIHNKQDLPSYLQIGAGSASEQDRFVTFLDKAEANAWSIWVDTGNLYNVWHRTTGIVRESLGLGNSFYNAEGGGGILFNAGTNSGSGGVVFYSGGASPVLGLGISGGGKLSTYNTLATVGNGVPSLHGATVALTAQTANLAATNVYAAAPVGEYRVCVNARTTASGTGTTATLNIIWTDEGGVKTDLVGTWALNSVTVTGQINKCEFIHAAAASNIQVSVTAGTYGTSVYAISAQIERLQ